MSLCLPQFAKEELIRGIKDGTVVPENMTMMSSAERQGLLRSFMDEASAKSVNTLFEEKLVLKSQRQGLKNWEKQIVDSKEYNVVKKDIISRVEKLEKVLDANSKQEFLQDLTEKKLGFSVTFEQSELIMKSAKSIRESHAKLDDSIPDFAENGKQHPLRQEYGMKVAILDKYIENIKEFGRTKMSVGDWLTSPEVWIDDIFGTMKSMKSGFDNSFFGRQGQQSFIESPTMWMKNFVKSWGDMAKEYKGVDAMTLAKAEVFGRRNAMNGKWSNMGLDIHLAFEEAYPSHLLRGLATSKVPGVGLFGKTYKASESAFSAGAMRMRADLADMLIKRGEEMGVDFMDKAQARPIGMLVNSMTGRGNLESIGLERSSRFLNVALFSARFLKSRIDILTAPLKWATMEGKMSIGKGKYNAGEVFARRTAALNTLKLISTMGAILAAFDEMQPGSVNWDSRSSDFGKIKVGNTRFDITGGLGSLVVLASRIAPSKHNGKWSQWRVNSKGKYTDLRKGGYGDDAFDVFLDWGTNKASPGAGVLISLMKGKDFSYDPITYQSLIEQATAPITISTLMDMKDEDASMILIGTLADALGINTSTY